MMMMSGSNDGVSWDDAVNDDGDSIDNYHDANVSTLAPHYLFPPPHIQTRCEAILFSLSFFLCLSVCLPVSPYFSPLLNFPFYYGQDVNN